MPRHHSVTAALVATALAVSAVPVHASDGDFDESTFLERTRRLIYEGRRSGEGYFSADGGLLVFQSERRPENPFYQIYLLDLATGDTREVSTGIGKTTCAFIRPDGSEILYGSTHHDPRSAELQQQELDFRASGQERRYAWDYDPEMDIYAVAMAGGEPRRLTDARGYDAEGAYSPDGEWIVFASTRDAFNRELSERERNLLEVDPAYFGEIYLMRADGSEQTRLTNVPGYDGGPFFFADGSRIVWRRFSEDGLIADVWSMNPDGSDQRQLTDFGAMSWAPYQHPSGQYIFFASNKLGFENFEVFIVDTEGTKEPVRVTYTDRFDGLPVPSPDGRRLVWTSSRHGGDGGQLYTRRLEPRGRARGSRVLAGPRSLRFAGRSEIGAREPRDHPRLARVRRPADGHGRRAESRRLPGRAACRTRRRAAARRRRPAARLRVHLRRSRHRLDDPHRYRDGRRRVQRPDANPGPGLLRLDGGRRRGGVRRLRHPGAGLPGLRLRQLRHARRQRQDRRRPALRARRPRRRGAGHPQPLLGPPLQGTDRAGRRAPWGSWS